MIKWIFIVIMVLIGLMDYALLVASSRVEEAEEERIRREKKDDDY